MESSTRRHLFTTSVLFVLIFVSVVFSLPSHPTGAEKPDARTNADTEESQTESYNFFTTSFPDEETYLARRRSLEVEGKDTLNSFQSSKKNIGFLNHPEDALSKILEISGFHKSKVEAPLDEWNDAESVDVEVMTEAVHTEEAEIKYARENDNGSDMEDTIDKNSGDNDETYGDGLVAGGHTKVDKAEIDEIEGKHEGNRENLQEGTVIELDEIDEREEHDNVGEKRENTDYAGSTSQLPVEYFTSIPEGTDGASTTDANYFNNHNSNGDEEAYVENDDVVRMEFENNEEEQNEKTTESDPNSDKVVAALNSSAKRNRGKNNRKSNKRKRNKNKNKRFNEFVLENGHQNTFQEIIEDFNLTLIELNLKRLNSSTSREPRQHILYTEDIHLGDPVNPPQLESVSLWQYFLNFMSGKESEPPPKSVIVEKHLDNPCDFLPGNYGNWLHNAKKKQVVVIGGGVAGLTAISTLNKLGMTDSILIEASNRLGGRVHTVRHGQWMVEEGAPRIQGEALNPLFQLALETGHVGGPEPLINWEDDVITSDGDVQDARIIRKGRSILEHLQQDPREWPTLRYYDKSLGELYSKWFDELWGPMSDGKDKQAWMYYIHQIISKEFGVNSWMNMAARDAANFQDLGRDIIWKGGMDGLVHHLLYGISSDQLHLSSPVCQVFWDRHEDDSPLVVLSDGSSYHADYIISAIPLGVLKEYHYKTFIPPLPRSMSNALAAVDAGVVDRIVLGWDYSWWGPKPFSHQFLWKDYNFPSEMEWMSNIVSIRGNPELPTQLEMEVFGDAAIAMENMSTEQVIAHLINFLRTTKRQYTVPLPAFFHRSKWRQNQWTRGSYHSYMNLNAVDFNFNDRTGLCPILANARGKKTLFFSGEHTSTNRFGTVDGALLSGARAARWVMDERATYEKLFLVVNGERRRLIPLDDQKLKIDYYQYFKNPTLAYLGALEISDDMQMEKRQIEEEKQKLKREQKLARKAAREQRKQKKNKKSKTSHSKEQEIYGESKQVFTDYEQSDAQKNIPESFQKRSRLGDHLPNGAHQQNSISVSQSAVPITTTTVALAPKFHSSPVQSSGSDLIQPQAIFQSMVPSSGEHLMTQQSKEMSVVYLNADGHPTDFNSGDNDEVSFVYLDGQARESDESGQPSVVYVEGLLNSKLTSLVDALSLRKLDYQTQPTKPDEREMLPATSKKGKKARKNQTKAKKMLKAKAEEAKEPKSATNKSETLREDKKRYRNKKKGNKKNGKKNKRNKKNHGKNKNQKHNLEDATQGETKTSIVQHSLHQSNPTFPYTGGMSIPHYLPYQGVHPMDHFSALSQNLMLEEMNRKTNSASKGNMSVERRKLQTQESLASSEISTTNRSFLPDPVTSFGSYNLASNKYLEHYIKENKDNKSNSNIPELFVTYPLGGSEVQPMYGYQSSIQDSQSQQIQSLNIPQHQTFQSSMGQTPSQHNFHTSSNLNQQNPGNVYSIGQHMSPPAPYNGFVSAHNQQNTHHLNFNSQSIGNLNSEKGLNHQHSPHSYTLSNPENHFRQHGIDNGFAMDTNSGLKYGSIERKTPHFDYIPQISQPVTTQQPLRGNFDIDKENRFEVSVNPPNYFGDSVEVEIKEDHASNNHKIPEATEEEKDMASKTKSISQEKDRNSNQEESKETKTISRGRKGNRQRPNKYSSHMGGNRNSFLNRQRYNRRPGQQPFILIPESSHLFLSRNNYGEEKNPSKSREIKSSEVSGTKERTETVSENGEKNKEAQENTADEPVSEIPRETSTAFVPQTENNGINQSVDLNMSLNKKPPFVNENQYFHAPIYPGGYPMIPAHSPFPFLYHLPYLNHFMQNNAPFALPPAERNGAAKSLEIIDSVVNVTDNVNGIEDSQSPAHLLEKQNNVTETIHSTFPELDSNHTDQTLPDHVVQEKTNTMNPEASDENTDIQEDEEVKIIRSNRKREQKVDRKNKKHKPQKSKPITGFISEEPDTDLHNTASERDTPVYEDIPHKFNRNISSEI